MANSILKDPVSLHNTVASEPFQPKDSSRLFLPKPSMGRLDSLDRILTNRRSRRVFGTLDIQSLSQLLWLTIKTCRITPTASISGVEFRPLPSAGACHVISTIVIQTADAEPSTSLYENKSHSLLSLSPVEDVVSIRTAVGSVLAPGRGTILLFAADTFKLADKYRDGESLAWRDAGVLIGGLSIAAEALKLSFCPLGFSGHELVQSLLQSERFMGVGGCIVGARVN